MIIKKTKQTTEVTMQLNAKANATSKVSTHCLTVHMHELQFNSHQQCLNVIKDNSMINDSLSSKV